MCIDGPAFDQVTTMSKFLCMGMLLPNVVAASTVNAAMALRRPELGSLKPGSAGDATLISVQQGQFDYVDAVGGTCSATARSCPKASSLPVVGGTRNNRRSSNSSLVRQNADGCDRAKM